MEAILDPLEEVAQELVDNIEIERDTRMVMSDSIGELAGALAKAQGAMDTVDKTTEGYGYNYADLASVINTLKKPLSQNGLAYTQGHYTDKKSDGKMYVYTDHMLMHSSGEWIKTSLGIPVPAMKQLQPAQLIGVVATYARRYLLQSSVGLASADTDGVPKTK